MTQKKTLNLSVPAELLDEFYTVCQHYGHAKQKGQVLSAALLMFLRADPAEQGRCLEEVVGAEITSGVEQLLERARKEQGLRIATREAAERAGQAEAAEAPGEASDTAGADEPSTGEGEVRESQATPHRRAARRAGDSVRGRSSLPEPPEGGEEGGE